MPELFVPLNVNWADNPKVIEVGLDGAGLHAAAMCLAKRMETDGVIHRAQLARYGGTPELIDRLIDIGLLDRLDKRRVRVHDWLDSNLSSQAIRTDRDGRRDASRRANHKRWGHTGPVDKCARCNASEQRNGQSDQSGNPANALHAPTTDNGDIRAGSGPSSERSPSESGSASLREIERGREIEIERGAAARSTRAELSPDPPAPAAAEDHSPAPAQGIGDPTERQALIDAAARILAERRAAVRPDVGAGWVRATAAGIAKDHHQRAHAHLASSPDPTPEQLADFLDPPRAKPPDPVTKAQAAQQAGVERSQRIHRGERCRPCGGTGWADQDDGTAAVCAACDGTGTGQPVEDDEPPDLAKVQAIQDGIRDRIRTPPPDTGEPA